MDSSKSFMFSSNPDQESILNSIYESQSKEPDSEKQRQRAGTFSSPTTMPLSLPSAPDNRKNKKRRSKHDLKGRDFNCEHCNNSYLSYPALYTHTKKKHVSAPLPSRSGRMNKSNKSLRSESEEIELIRVQDVSQDLSKTFIKVVERLNDQIGWGLDEFEEHPLLKVMKSNKPENTCDWTLIEYCKSVAKTLSVDYLEKVCLTVFAYRECLNQYGWKKFASNHQEEVKSNECASDSPRIETVLDYTEEYQLKIKQEFSANNDADRLPELANEFVLLFAREYKLGIEEKEIIDIVMNMCTWLYNNKYTRTQMVLIN